MSDAPALEAACAALAAIFMSHPELRSVFFETFSWISNRKPGGRTRLALRIDGQWMGFYERGQLADSRGPLAGSPRGSLLDWALSPEGSALIKRRGHLGVNRRAHLGPALDDIMAQCLEPEELSAWQARALEAAVPPAALGPARSL